MIQAWFGIERPPFAPAPQPELLPGQQEIFDTLRVHAQQGGLCLVVGEPGTGKSVLRSAIAAHDPKRIIVPVITRTLHSYFNTLRILCHVCALDADGSDHRCEQRLIEHALAINRAGKMLVPVVDDAHLLETACLRKLRLLFESFPKNHNLVLLGQMPLLSLVRLAVNADIRSRITYSAILHKLNPDQIREFILAQLDRARLGHNTFTEDALELIVRSSEGFLRRARNLCVGALVEATRERVKTIELKQVNTVLVQPHWRTNQHDVDER